MQLNRFTDLGLRVLLSLQQRDHHTQLSTVDNLATELAVSRNHLVKIVHFMAQSGWIESFKGRTGGIRLASAAPQLLLGDIITALEEASSGYPHLINCHTPPCSLAGYCYLPTILTGAQQAFYAYLNRYTLQDLGQSNSREHIIQWLK